MGSHTADERADARVAPRRGFHLLDALMLGWIAGGCLLLGLLTLLAANSNIT